MPSLQGYEVQTHALRRGADLDVLHPPDKDLSLWVPGQQVASLSGLGRRATGEYSTSDMVGGISEKYRIRVPDPHRLYTRSRVKSTTLFSVEGLIQKTFHTNHPGYFQFCKDFIENVLPGYVPFAAYHAELIMAWTEVIDHFDAVGKTMRPAALSSAIMQWHKRLSLEPTATPVLILATIAADYVLDAWAKAKLQKVPVVDSKHVLTFHVAHLDTAYKRTLARRERQPDEPLLGVHLALMWPDGKIQRCGGEVIAPGQPAEEAPKPPPEPEPAVDRPLPGLPVAFGDLPCPTFGSYEDPEWVGPYVCDALGLVNISQALGRIPAEEKGICIVDTADGPRSMITVKESGLYRLIATSRKPRAKLFKDWLFCDVLPKIRRYGYYAMPGAKPGPATTEEMWAMLRTIVKEELPGAIEPLIQKGIWAQISSGQLGELVVPLTDAAKRLAEISVIHEQQLVLMRETMDLILPTKQLYLSAQDYVEADGVTEALRRAPKLAVPVFGMNHCPDYGAASGFMKKLCKAEQRKVGVNAVARIIAKNNGLEMPPLYITEYLMIHGEDEYDKVLKFTPPCWAFCKETFLPAGTPTLRFPDAKIEKPPEGEPKQAEEA